jgi:hypothetical protein
MKYGIIFWGNYMTVKRVFQLQKRIVRIITGARSRSSCKPTFKAFKILTIPSQYILSLITFMVNNMEYFSFNFYGYNIYTRKKLQLHRPTENLT